MKRVLLKILPYFLTTILVVGFWKIQTSTDNYAWFPKGKELLALDIALTQIFVFKTIFWLIISNLTIFLISQIFQKNYRNSILTFIIGVITYIFGGQIINKECAFSYYTVFMNQSVSEEYLQKPINQAGYYIGTILCDNVKDQEMKYRRYGINGLGNIGYRPATTTLKQILLDKSEPDFIRADVYQALQQFKTDEANKILTDFKNINMADTIDSKVIHLIDYWTKQK